MIILLLIFLIFLIFPFLILKKIKQIIYTLTAVLSLFLTVGFGLQAKFILRALQIAPKLSQTVWADKNVIVLLGNGIAFWPKEKIYLTQSFAYSRQREALRLYLDCKSQRKICHILASGGDPKKRGTSEAQVLSEELQLFSVAKEDIILEDKSYDTYQNADFSSKIIKENNYENVVLVTSHIHMARSILFFNHFGVNAIPAPSDFLEPISSYKHMAYNFLITDMALHELAGMIWFKYFRN